MSAMYNLSALGAGQMQFDPQMLIAGVAAAGGGDADGGGGQQPAQRRKGGGGRRKQQVQQQYSEGEEMEGEDDDDADWSWKHKVCTTDNRWTGDTRESLPSLPLRGYTRVLCLMFSVCTSCAAVVLRWEASKQAGLQAPARAPRGPLLLLTAHPLPFCHAVQRTWQLCTATAAAQEEQAAAGVFD